MPMPLNPKDPSVYVIAEIGINHNGSPELAKQLIDVANNAGCDAVKFQKRTVESVYTPEELKQSRSSPFGETNGDLKHGLEFSADTYHELAAYSRDRNIDFAASCWDMESLEFIDTLEPAFHKIASPMLTYAPMLDRVREMGRPVIASIGMSSEQEIVQAMEHLNGPDTTLLVCTSTYPNKDAEANLCRIDTLQQRFGVSVGYSGHEVDHLATLAATGRGAKVIERHITLSQNMFGSDQSVSMEPTQLTTMIADIRRMQAMFGDGKIAALDAELPVRDKLRKYSFQS